MDALLTLDIGTTSAKAAIVSREGVIDARTSSYATSSPRSGWFEQSQEEVTRAAFRAASDAVSACGAARVIAVGITGHMNGLSAVDVGGRPLAPHILHSDIRARDALAEIASTISHADYYALTGNRIDVHATLPKALWLKKHAPGVFLRAARLLNIKDVVRGALTGDYASTDASDGALTGAMNIATRAWAGDLLRDLGIPIGKMPDIRASHDVSQTVCAQAAKLIGVSEGTPVAIGGGDGACASAGAGLSRPGAAYANIGSTAWVSALLDKPYADPEMRAFHYSDLSGRYVSLCGTVQSGAAALSFAARAIGADVRRLCALAEKSADGARGAFFLPYIAGERTPHWDVGATGAFLNLRADHTREDMARAALEGVVHALCDCFDVIREAMRETGSGEPEKLTLIGGAAGADIIPRLVAGAFGVPVSTHERAAHATALGAAMAAGVGVGFFSTYDEAAALARSAPPVMPGLLPEILARRAVWKTLYPSMKGVYQNMGGQCHA